MSAKKIAVLGGPFPGVTSKAPYIPVGAAAPIFPMVIRCSTEADATQVMKLAELIRDVHDGMTPTQVASVFYHGFDDDDIDVPGPFYAVCIASYPAIYTNWHKVSSILAGWSSPRWCKQDSLKAAILFMIMKGKGFKPTDINSEQAFLEPRSASPAGSSVHTVDKGKFKQRSTSPLKRVIRFEDMGNVPSTASQIPKAATLKTSISEGLPKDAPNDRQLLFLKKDFPKPFFPSSTHSSYNFENDDTPLILQYIRKLSGLLAIVTEPSMLPQADIDPTGLGIAVDEYLSAHGYTADAQCVIVRAFKLHTSQDAFAGFLSGKGMAKSEALWLWRFIDRQTD